MFFRQRERGLRSGSDLGQSNSEPSTPSEVPVRYRFNVPPTRRIGRRLLAFKWAALVFTALAVVVALWQLLHARSMSLLLSVPSQLLPVAQSTLPHPVSNVAIGVSLIVLGLVVFAQLLLLAFTQLGRRSPVIPIVTEIALWTAFCVASYVMQRGYRANIGCTGPPTHCWVTYPSVLPALISGFIIGAVIGAAWSIAYRIDERRMRTAPERPSTPRVAEQG